ncbi:sensor domain-containing diguanylate cyclase [Phyllobacterium sp. P30BS-XVII]|uniref:sensor domain-containing diguanylate cyclase n=1 Tax=Phyllobacterium sp. P30BS-XVII TaxID=2587046 RepID=UPI0015FCC57A|nr:sensor domain-containing diguanylate cyclase [Phyllobacterium sp. P30BS-XVII]MBA8902069.1 diguanylate cyclase (GGDEF)-like protein [Phyllobacterium sp. P30BS-XVII]
MDKFNLHQDEIDAFDLAPISLWLEDFSAVRELFDSLRGAGVDDIVAYLREDEARIRECARLIRVQKVNKKTLSLFEAADFAELVANLGAIFRDDMLQTHVQELGQLWSGKGEFSSNTVNYTLSGKRLDIQLRGKILPGYEASWEKVLISIEDVTDREDARRQHAASQQYAEGLFEHSPVSLWVEDFSKIRKLLNGLRERGIEDFRVFTDVHPEFVQQCASEIRVIDVNRETLKLFQAPDAMTLLRRLPDVFRDEMNIHFREQLIDLWNGKLFHQRETVNYALDGSERHVLLQFSVLPGHENDWSLVQISLTDITARKKAEAYLEYLGKHDVLTRLHNRAFYVDELNRLERREFFPVSIIILDLNGLKITNDQWGHGVGDSLLRRAGEILSEAVKPPHYAARIGGDEFAVLLPAVDETGAVAVVEEISSLIEINNQYYSNIPLSFSIGWATSATGEKLEAVAKRADLLMYQDKRLRYSTIESGWRNNKPENEPR